MFLTSTFFFLLEFEAIVTYVCFFQNVIPNVFRNACLRNNYRLTTLGTMRVKLNATFIAGRPNLDFIPVHIHYVRLLAILIAAGTLAYIAFNCHPVNFLLPANMKFEQFHILPP